MTEQDIRETVMIWAKGFVGIKEGSPEHKTLIDLYNQYKPLPRGYKVTYKDAWCAVFVSDAMWIHELDFTVPPECSCYYMMANAKADGIWRDAGTITQEQLKQGDIIMYNWDKAPDPDHVGLIDSFISPNMVKVVEGNKDDSVGYRYIDITDKSVMGFILPKYAEHHEIEAPEEEENDNIYENVMNWNWDGTGWWYPYGKKKGQYHCNNAWRIDGKLYFFDTEGYAVKNPLNIEISDKGEVLYIHGTRVGYNEL